MDAIWATTQQGNYPIFIGSGYFTYPALFESFISGKQALIVSSPQIAQHYLPQLTKTLQQLQLEQIDSFSIPEGESHKTLFYAEKIWTYLLEKKHYRDTTLIALGGGMIGDLTGFCAACYLRGVSVIQCPSTLLAQIDAAIGGKVGVNHPLGKNMIGAFYPPRAVISDVLTLDSLSQGEYVAGIAELIKYGLVLDRSFFEWLELHMPALLAKDKAIIEQAVKRAAALKVEIVALDEKEKEIRMLLNFGHTIGHALESFLAYQSIKHGEAVALGMIAAVHLSLLKGTLDPGVLERLTALLKFAGLPTVFPAGVKVEGLLAKLSQDKKHIQKKLRWVLLKNIGQAYLEENLSTEQIVSTLKAYGAQG